MRNPIGAAGVLALWLVCGAAQAATFTVTNTNDSGPGSLREAINLANTGLGADTINFGVSGVIILASQLEITDDLTIDGRGARIVISGNSRVRVLRAGDRPGRGCSALTLIKLTIAKGATSGYGGGLYGCGTLNVVDSSFDSNTSGSYGGAIAYASTYPTTGTNSVNISGSTFHGNSAGEPFLVGNQGGAIYLWVPDPRLPEPGYVPPPPQTYTVTNSTFSRNFLISRCDIFPCHGNAIHVEGRSSDKLVITNSTLALNNLATAGIQQWAVNTSVTEVVFRNTILANSPGRNCPSPSPDPRWITRITDGGGNLSSDASCGFSEPSSVNSTDAQLGPLRDNGGPTLTMAPLSGSPAIDLGVNAVAVDSAGVPLATDQRGVGFARIFPSGGTVDRGAIEVAGFRFAGFFRPIENFPILNLTKAGASVPVRFSLNGYQGMAIFAAGSPYSQDVVCEKGSATNGVEEPVVENGNGLSYDATTDQYQFVWRTEKSWQAACRNLILKFSDGTVREALFQFK